MISQLAFYANYGAAVFIMFAGLLIVMIERNAIRRLIGLALFQTSIGIFFLSAGKVRGGTAAILIDPSSPEAARLARAAPEPVLASAGVEGVVYSNPLPHVLILTAIVVGVSVLAVGLAIAIRIRETEPGAASCGVGSGEQMS